MEITPLSEDSIKLIESLIKNKKNLTDTNIRELYLIHNINFNNLRYYLNQEKKKIHILEEDQKTTKIKRRWDNLTLFNKIIHDKFYSFISVVSNDNKAFLGTFNNESITLSNETIKELQGALNGR